jgi:hypothetical protein
MLHRLGKANLLLAAGLVVTGCTGEDTSVLPNGGTGGSSVTNPYNSYPAQGGGFVGQGGGFVGQGGNVVGQGGASVGFGGAGTTHPATTIGGASTTLGGAAATGGAKTGGAAATGGAKTGGAAATGGAKTGGAAATGGAKTGGAAATGGAAPTGGTSSAAGASSTAPQNLYTVGPYTGAGWVAGGTNLTTFTNPTVSGTKQTFASTTALCMSASVTALQSCTAAGVTCNTGDTMNYSEDWGAMVALNTTATEGSPKGNTFANIAVTFTGSVTPASTPVRLQVQLKDKSTYCVNNYSSGLQTPIANFIKDCYSNPTTPISLTTADTANITSIQLSIASGTTAVSISNVCITDIKLDGTTTTTPTTTCNDTATASGTLTNYPSFATIPTSSGAKSYVLQSNWWGAFSGQKETYSGLSFTLDGTGAFQDASKPLGYPSLFIGSYNSQTSVGSNLPKQVSSLTTVPTVYNWSGASDVSHFNASYDVWFTASNAKVTTGDPGSGGAYLMVWMFMPSDQTPRGSKVTNMPPVTIPGAPGNWTVWYDPSGAAPCVSYVANSKINNLSFDLNEFIKHAVANNLGVKNSQYLSIIFGGFEVWQGHNGLKLDKFCAQVN